MNYAREKRKFSRVCAIVLAFLMLSTMSVGQMPVWADSVSENTVSEEPTEVGSETIVPTKTEEPVGAGTALAGSGLLKDYTVRKGTKDLENGNCVISEEDDLKIYYKLKDLLVDQEAESSGEPIALNDSYTFQVPSTLTVTNTADWDVNINDQNGVSRKLGTASYDDGTHSITLTIDQDAIFDAGNAIISILDTYIGFDAKLNATELGASNGEPKSINFDFGTNPNFSFTYGVNHDTDAAIAKTVAYDAATETASWTLTVTDGSKTYVGDMKLSDTFPNSMSYVAGSFKDGTTPVDDTALHLTNNASDKSTTFTYTYQPTTAESGAHVAGTVHTFTYQTKFNKEIFLSDGKLKTQVVRDATNTVKLLDGADKQIATAEQSVGDGSSATYTWNDKTVNREYDPVTDTVTYHWTIDVNTNGFSFQNLTLHDSLKAKINNTTSEYKVLADTVKVTPDGQSAVSYTMSKAEGSAAFITTGTLDGTTGKPSGNGDFLWTLKINNGALTTGIYTITYDTQLTNYSEYRKYNQPQMTNSANLTFDWPDYTGPGTGLGLGTPTVTKKAEECSNLQICRQLQ